MYLPYKNFEITKEGIWYYAWQTFYKNDGTVDIKVSFKKALTRKRLIKKIDKACELF